MSKPDLKAIKERCEAETAVTDKYSGGDLTTINRMYKYGRDCIKLVPALLDEIERLKPFEDENKRLREALEKVFNEFRNSNNLDKDQLDAMQQADDILTPKENNEEET